MLRCCTFSYTSDGVGWGGGWDVNVPCTSYITCCYAVEISGIVATSHVVTLLMVWGGGWDVNVPCTSYITCCYAVEISGIVATSHVVTLLMVWGGVGVGC